MAYLSTGVAAILHSFPFFDYKKKFDNTLPKKAGQL